MFEAPIVLETRKYREEFAASLGYDLDRIVADLQSRQGLDGRVVVDRTSVEESEQADARADWKWFDDKRVKLPPE